MTIYIRTEANRTTATGHMTRCIAIAKEIRAMGGEVVFIIAEKESAMLPVKAGFEYICMDRKWDDFDGEIPVISKLIEDNNIKCMLVDSYYVSKEYMRALSKKTKTAYIDDLHDGIWPVHAIINYAVYYDLFDYETEYPDSDKLLGCSYMPLRPEYVGITPSARDDVREILVVTGGGDEYHFIKNVTSLVQGCRKLDGVHFTFICGMFNVDYEELSAKYRDSSMMTVLKSVPSLRDYLLDSDIIITAGGTTLYEAAVCQVPCIAFRIADNQDYNVTSFGKKGLAIDAGDVRKDFSYETLLDRVIEFKENAEERKKMRDRQGDTLDGQGAGKIARYLLEACGGDR